MLAGILAGILLEGLEMPGGVRLYGGTITEGLGCLMARWRPTIVTSQVDRVGGGGERESEGETKPREVGMERARRADRDGSAERRGRVKRVERKEDGGRNGAKRTTMREEDGRTLKRRGTKEGRPKGDVERE
ncbi:hypothetical protein KM043_001354 [Ampulex compressa]|nr:hypothetical protein KM043_001354 [Ampulex compressa]